MIVGGLSATFTVLVTSGAARPLVSVTLKVTVYVPSVDVSTLFTVLMSVDIFPST